ncbi:MAG TPA: HD domain-containing phosphohydrolase [Anaerolineaceae bacterium]
MKYKPTTRKFIAVVTVVAIGVTAALLTQYTFPQTAREWVLLAVFTFLLVLSNSYSLPFSEKVNLQLSTIVIVAAILLFDPAEAVLIGATGKAISCVLRRKRFEQLAFNSSQVVIYTSASSLVLRAISPETPWNPTALRDWIGVFGSSGLIMLINTLLTGSVVALETGKPLLITWKKIGRLCLTQDPAQISLGILSGLLVTVFPWALVLMGIPVGVLYETLRRQRDTEEQRQRLLNQNSALVVSLQDQTAQLQKVVGDLESALEANRKANLSLELEIAQRVVAQRNLTAAYDDLLQGLTRALELRDQDTEGHSQRVTQLTVDLARQLGMPESEIGELWRGALLHDIGKIGIPDAILNNPGQLSADEVQVMHRHPIYAYELLRKIEYLRNSIDIPYCHHERWDGSGYPRGLRGEEIPLAARVFALADVWDALRSDRPYRRAWSDEEAWEHICAQSGKHFDPRVVEAFKQHHELIKGVQLRASKSIHRQPVDLDALSD